MRFARPVAVILFLLGVGCGGASVGVDDDPGTPDPDVGMSVGGDVTEGEANIDFDIGDDDDADDVGEAPGK